MKLIHQENRFIFICSFENREVAKTSGFQWDDQIKKWVTSSPSTAMKLYDYADDSAKNVLRTRFVHSLQPIGAITTPIGCTLRKYQEDAIKFISSRNRSYLALDPGLGKTIIAATAANLRRGKVLYITPPFLKFNIEREFARWAPSLRCKIIHSTRDKMDLDHYEVIILPDSIIANDLVYEAVSQYKFTWCFVDEAHRFKTFEAKRTKALFGHGKTKALAIADHIVMMSGTPMPNRPIELWPVLSSQAPEVINFRNYFEYAAKYCNAHTTQFGLDVSGASNLHILKAEIRKKYMMRLVKKDVLNELPPKIHNVVLVEGEKTKNMRLSPQLIKEFDLKLVDNMPLGETARLRREFGLEKLKFSTQYLQETLNEPTIVYAYHREVIDTLARELEDLEPQIIYGGVDVEKRDNIVKYFQNGKTNLIIGNLHAMGVGLTLTRATRIVFVEYDWTPGINEQAEDRAHRIGQEKSVLIEYVVIKDTLDELIVKSFLNKKRSINILMGVE